MSNQRKQSKIETSEAKQADEARADIPNLLSDMELSYLDLKNEPERLNRIKEITRILPDHVVVGTASRLREGKNQMLHNPDDFFKTYSISPAEADLAKSLADGMTVTDYAANKKVSVNTVRTQVRSLFEKTNASNQTDLVRLYLNHRTY